MQGSSKAMIFDHIRIEDFSPMRVEGGEVIFSSGEGFEMSEEEMRAWKSATEAELKPHLMSSSKSGPVMTLDEFMKVREARQKISSWDGAKSPNALMNSSKASSPIFKPKDLEKIIEGGNKEPKPELDLPPQEPEN